MDKPKVHNLPKYAKNYKYLVVTRDAEYNLWFYGAYDNLREAFTISGSIKGMVLDTWESEEQ